jgi:hypothetical protein
MVIGDDPVALYNTPAPTFSESPIEATTGQKSNTIVAVKAIGMKAIPADQGFDEGREMLATHREFRAEAEGVHVGIVAMVGVEIPSIAPKVGAEIAGHPKPLVEVVR